MKPKQLIITGGLVFIFGVLFGFLQTVFFLWKYGFHIMPCNRSEAFCDWIGYSMVLLGGLFMIRGVIRQIIDFELKKS